jgi:tetratricopeptide (TPR) repeat protein
MEGAKLEPDKPYFYQLLGDAYRESGAFTEAAEAYKQAAQRTQNSSDLYYFAALSYAGARKTDQQQADAMEAIKRGTLFLGEAWFLVGNSLAAGRRYDEAAGAFEKSISAKPSLKESYEQLSDVYRNLNQFAKAISTQQQVIKLYPDDANLFANLSWYLSLADKPLDAISAAQQSIRVNPNASAFTNLCRAYNDSKQYANAIQACNSALKINPDDGETYFYLARANDLLGRSDSATPLYKKAVEGLVKFTNENPNYSDGFYLLGNAYYAVENRAAAVAAYKKCLEVSPRFAKARYNLGYIFTLLGDKANARMQYDALTSLDSLLAEKLLQAMNEMK